MDFAQMLDGMARAQSDDIMRGPSTPSANADFWRVLEGLERSPRMDGTAARDAYRDFHPSHSDRRPADGRTADTRVPEPLHLDAPSFDTDPEEIAFELDLGNVRSLDELSSLRRKFAMLNHPDRVPAPYREAATARMTVANALIDRAAARLTRWRG